MGAGMTIGSDGPVSSFAKIAEDRNVRGITATNAQPLRELSLKIERNTDPTLNPGLYNARGKVVGGDMNAGSSFQATA